MALPYNPTIKVLLTGLMAVTQEGSRAKIGIIKRWPHQLFLYILETSSGGLEVANLTDRVQGDIRLESNLSGVSFHGDGPFARTPKYDDEYDFRWVTTLDGKEFHDRHLPRMPRGDGTFAVRIRNLYIDSGTFYCANKFEVKKVFPNGSAPPFPDGLDPAFVYQEVSFVIGVNLTLGSGDTARLTYRGGRFDFDRRREYYVLIANLPRSLHDDKASSHAHTDDSHLKRSGKRGKRGSGKPPDLPSHFKLYYEVFNSVCCDDQYDMCGIHQERRHPELSEPSPLEDFRNSVELRKLPPVDASKIPDLPLVTYSNPCLPIFLSQTSIEDEHQMP